MNHSSVIKMHIFPTKLVFVSFLLAMAVLSSAQFTFSGLEVIHTNADAYGMTIADFNNDGIPDVALSTENVDKVDVHVGDGAGDFTQLGGSYFLGTSTGPRDIVHIDYDLDGDYDLAVTYSRNDVIRLLVNDGTGLFSFGPFVSTGLLPTKLAVVDFDGDDDDDLVVLNRDGGTISLLANVGGGMFSETAYPVGLDPRALVSGDFDGDGDADFAVTNLLSANITVWYNDGTGNLSGRQDLPTIHPFLPYDIDSKDINGDGLDDLVSAGWGDDGMNNRVYGVNVFLSNGAGFDAPVFYSLRLWAGFQHEILTLGDFDSDGDLDILGGANINGALDFLVNSGNGTFTPGFEMYGGADMTEMQNYDLNGDLKPDILATHLVNAGGTGPHMDYFMNTTSGNWLQMPPTSYQLERGSEAFGNLQSVATSNNDYLALRPGVTLGTSEYPIRMIAEATAASATPLRLKFGIEMHAMALGIRQRIEVYNFAQSKWDVLDVRTSRRGDDMLWFDVPDRADHIEPGTRRVRARVSYKATRPVLSFPWSVRVDRVSWATR